MSDKIETTSLSEISRQITWILASQSPRRKKILQDAGVQLIVFPSDEWIEEKPSKNENPSIYVCRTALAKGTNVVQKILSITQSSALQNSTLQNSTLRSSALQNLTLQSSALQNLIERSARPILVLACDTVAVCDGQILGKPNGRKDADRMLQMLSGEEHQVISGTALFFLVQNKCLKTVQEETVSVLKMEKLSDVQRNAYLDSGAWQGKAGAFGYQDGNDWVHLISGTESNVVGLPIETVERSAKAIFQEFAAFFR